MIIDNQRGNNFEKRFADKIKILDLMSEAICQYEKQQIGIAQELAKYFFETNKDGKFIVSNEDLQDPTMIHLQNKKNAKYLKYINQILLIAVAKRSTNCLNKNYLQAIYPKIYTKIICDKGSYFLDYACAIAELVFKSRFVAPNKKVKDIASINLFGSNLVVKI